MELKAQVYINNILNELASSRLLNFSIEDNAGMQLDSLTLNINNADKSIQIPSTNAIIELHIGYSNLYKMGKFVAQYINASGTNIAIKGISQDFNIGKIKHNRVFKNKSLSDVLNTLASDLNLVLQLDNSFKSKEISYYLQENKTSMELLHELSEIYYALANIKDGNLVFVSKENTKVIDIIENSIISIKKEDANTKYYNGVTYSSWDTQTATLNTTKTGQEPYLILPKAIDESLKNDYINSQFKAIQQTNLISITLNGNPQLQAGFSFNITDAIYPEFSGKYCITQVTHNYSNAYVTSILAFKIS